MTELHPGLAWMRDDPAAAPWLDRLPNLLLACVERWSLTLGEPYAYASSSYVVRATMSDGSPAALKVAWPHREAMHEADALRFWNGDGSVLLLAHDRESEAMLLERVDPGTPLKDLPEDEALDAIEDVMTRLWRPAGAPFTTLSEEARWWSEYLPVVWEVAPNRFERRLLDAALDALDGLPPTQGELVLVHQDLHADNVLKGSRQPWIAIDPKPLLGEREFGVAAVIRGDELGRGPDRVRHRLERVTRDLGLDRERAKMWTFAQTLAWAVDEDRNVVLPEHVDVARWVLDA